MLGRTVSEVNPKPATNEELFLELQVQSGKIHPLKIQKLIRSMRKSVRECIGTTGGPTHYLRILVQLSFWGACPPGGLLDWRAIVIDQPLVLVTIFGVKMLLLISMIFVDYIFCY